MLQTRIITAAVLLIAFGSALFLASVQLFALVLGCVAAAAAWEWSRLCHVDNEHAQTAYAAIVGVLSLAALYVPYGATVMQWVLLLGFLYWLSAPCTFYMHPKLKAFEHMQRGSLALGAFVMLLTVLALQYLRSDAPQASPWLLLYALSIIWVMDIGAYFSGRRFGRRKLAPLISPGKTREGVYGGMLATAILMIVVLFAADFAKGNTIKLLFATALAAAASVIGDLSESRLKRAADMKDSSQMLPGHGGVLDRIDSVLAAIPLFAFVWAWL